MFIKALYNLKYIFVRTKKAVMTSFNVDIQYYILRNNIKELRKYSSTEIIHQKYLFSKYIVPSTLLRYVLDSRNSIRKIFDIEFYAYGSSYTVRLPNGTLVVAYDKWIFSSSPELYVEYQGKFIFNNDEEQYFIEMFKRILDMTSHERSTVSQIQEKTTINKIRAGL